MTTRCTTCNAKNADSASVCARCGSNMVGMVNTTDITTTVPTSPHSASAGSIALIILCVIYLLNPLFGIDFIPDYIPVAGNLDDAGAAYLLIKNLVHLGRIHLPEQEEGGNSFWYLAAGAFCVLYLLNPFFGVDLIPDQIPVAGNLDEAGVAYFFMRLLSRQGWLNLS